MMGNDMITDRTQADVTAAKKIRDEKVKTFQTLADSDVETLERGTMTIATLNRIEGKQAELKNLLNCLGYWNIPIENKIDWAYNDIFTEADFRRIIHNENVLRNAFFTYNDTPTTPGISYYYEDLNAIEKILQDIDILINDVKSNCRECGAFNCGEG